ncbi:MAG TPA: hypothetical protein VF532_13370 [Candidatus Angelobacter sp.]
MKQSACILVVLCLWQGAYAQHQHAAPEKLGTVSFPNSCSPPVQAKFNRAVALLHSFTYDPAAEAFAEVVRLDPDCAMAHWGVAMSGYHQLWQPPLPGDAVQKGRAELETAQKAKADAKEKQFLSAAAFIFQDGAYPERAARYRDAMSALAKQNPTDVEAQIFYALALLATASPQDKTHKNQKEAAQILGPLYGKYPQHPGLAHYLIHASDNSEMAASGLKPAREYSEIAPSAPHALHMPSHIFTRLGMWSDSMRSNQAAREAARKQGDIGEELHSMDYLVYASLQKASYSETVAVLNDLKNMGTLGSDFKVSYAATAMPVRYALERKQWKDATRCVSPAGAPPHVAALAAWARALGDARTGDVAAAKSELQALRKFADQLRTAGNLYWAGQVDIQAEEAGGWIAQAEQKQGEALALLKKAADDEDAVEKLPVTPGPVVPAREQLAELLAMMGRPREALAEYETSLQNAPGRRASLQGAMESAKAAGAKQKSGQYQAALEKLN